MLSPTLMTRLGVPWLWGADMEKGWIFMRFNVVPITAMIMAPGSWAYGTDRIPLEGGAVLGDQPPLGDRSATCRLVLEPGALLHDEARAPRHAHRRRGPQLDRRVPDQARRPGPGRPAEGARADQRRAHRGRLRRGHTAAVRLPGRDSHGRADHRDEGSTSRSSPAGSSRSAGAGRTSDRAAWSTASR